MKRLPAERPLFAQDGRGAEGVAAVQRDGVVENVKDSHNLSAAQGGRRITQQLPGPYRLPLRQHGGFRV